MTSSVALQSAQIWRPALVIVFTWLATGGKRTHETVFVKLLASAHPCKREESPEALTGQGKTRK